MWIQLCLSLLLVQHTRCSKYDVGDCQIEGCDISEGWSSTTTTESGDGLLHGPFGVETSSVSRTFEELEEHKGLQLQMRVWIADTWDTESFSIALDGEIIFSTTYYSGSACTSIGFIDAVEGVYPVDRSNHDCYQDLNIYIPHTSSSVTVEFQSTLDATITDESWAFNKFVLWIISAGATWGSFTTSSATTPLSTTTGSHRSFANIVEYHGGCVIEPTDFITPGYLDKIDVFFTSDLTRLIKLPEQQTLYDWVSNGGVLIITPKENGEMEEMLITRMFGMGIYGFVDGLPHSVIIEDESVHQVFQGIQELYFEDDSPFMVEDFVQVLIPSGDNRATMAVLEDIGTGCGAVLVTEHHMWMETNIFFMDNPKFAKNVVLWANEKSDDVIDLWYPRVSIEDVEQCES